MNHQILTDEQINAGLIIKEDDHCVYLEDAKTGQRIAIFGCCATRKNIHKAADEYMKEV